MKTLKIAGLQLVVALLGWGLFSLGVYVKTRPGDLLNVSLFGIAIIDSIVLSVCATAALACLAVVLGLFRSYAD